MVAPVPKPAKTDMNDNKSQAIDKTVTGNFFEDFTLGQEIVHATPRTVTVGDVSLFTALYGPRFAVQSSDAFAQGIGYPRSPIDDLLVFHIVIGKTVPDISRNAIANLGYAEFRFLAPVYPGDTLASVSKVIGVKENSNKKSGTVYVRSTGRNQRGEEVLSFARWVMVNKRNPDAPPRLPSFLSSPRASIPRRSAQPCRSSSSRSTTMRFPARPDASATTPSATRSTMSMGRPSRRPSISSPRACSRTRRASISISISRARAGSGGGSSMAATSSPSPAP